jgi:uncharacterized protein
MEQKIQEDLKKAQLSRDELKVSTLRLLLSEFKYARLQKGMHASGEGGLSDQDAITVVQKEVKKRKESAEAFRNGGRIESAEKEEAELKILQDYLPAQMQLGELTKIVEDSINELGASGMSDMGRVIGVVMGKVGQSAEGGTVSSLVKERLSS